MPITLPPLPEQRRIVATIEQQFTRLDAGVAALQRARARAKRYRTAVEVRLTAAWRAANPPAESGADLLRCILAERRERWATDLHAKGKDPAKAKCEEPVRPDTAGLPALQEEWACLTFSQAVFRTRYGSLAKTSSEEEGVPILRMGSIRDGELDLSDFKC